MPATFVSSVNIFWDYAGYYGPYNSPSVGDGEILVTLMTAPDGRNTLATPYIISGTRYFTVGRDQSGGGEAWTGSTKICYHLTPDLGVNAIYATNQAQGGMVIATLKGVNPVNPIGQTYGHYGFGNPDTWHDMTPDDALNSLILGCAHCGEAGGFYGSSNEGTNIWYRNISGDTRTIFHQYSQLSTGGYGAVVRHHYDWGGGYNDNCINMVEMLAVLGGGNQVIWCMSKVYDRIQENRKKLGIGDLGNFGQTNGLWKPKSGLVTI